MHLAPWRRKGAPEGAPVGRLDLDVTERDGHEPVGLLGGQALDGLLHQRLTQRVLHGGGGERSGDGVEEVLHGVLLVWCSLSLSEFERLV
jgi:hypothetical protein